jgi:hypothetical protein
MGWRCPVWACLQSPLGWASSWLAKAWDRTDKTVEVRLIMFALGARLGMVLLALD